MKGRILCTTTGLALAAGLVGFFVAASPAAAITWGDPDREHKNVGAMITYGTEFGYELWCSGTLVHPRVVLTAGHCTTELEDYGITKVWVSFDLDVRKISEWQEVERVITHPDYEWARMQDSHDVGMLVLAEPAANLEPATLPSEGLLDDLLAAGELRQGNTGAKFTLVGYGYTLSWPPPIQAFSGIRQSSVSEYQALLQTWLRMSQNQATDDGGTCYGDSGGPAFWEHPDGTEILVGVTSWGDVPCVASAFNYRVDTAGTLDFIDDVIASLDEQ
jgi:secreted trypsin-like serine protease